MVTEARKKWYAANRGRLLLEAKTKPHRRNETKKSWLVLNGHKPKVRFDKAKNNRHSRKKGWFLLFEEYAALIAKPCHYCGEDTSQAKGCGLDRLDNSKGYILGNVVSCCAICNTGRSENFTPEEWKIAIAAILRFRQQKNQVE